MRGKQIKNTGEEKQAVNVIESSQLIDKIMADIKKELTDEEIINILLDSKKEVYKQKNSDKNTFGQNAADKVAKFAGSWVFIGIFALMLATWITINLLVGDSSFDPYPFILLNLILSTIAAVQAPMIMMSQNRQEEKDRKRAENDYRVNLQAEIIIEGLYHKVEELSGVQQEIKQLREEIKNISK